MREQCLVLLRKVAATNSDRMTLGLNPEQVRVAWPHGEHGKLQILHPKFHKLSTKP